MKKPTLATLLLALSAPLFSQEQTWPAAPAVLIGLAQNARAVVRERATELEVSSPSEAVWRERTVVTVMAEGAGFDEFDVQISPKYRKVTALWAKIYDSSGSLVRTIKKSDFTDQALSDGSSLVTDARARWANVQYGQLPYTVETFSETKMDGILSWPSWRPADRFGWAVQSASLRVSFPPNMAPKWLAEGMDSVVPAETVLKNGNRQLEFLVKNRLPTTSEPMALTTLPAIHFAPSAVELEGFTGDLRDWASFGRFYYKINENRGKLTPETAAEVHRLTDNLPSPHEKIAALYRFLQSSSRYVSIQLGLGGWQTMTAESVCRNKYGDCKALTNFMQAMLAEAGIESFAALVEGDRDEPMPVGAGFVHDGFNHVILFVPGENLWLECTSTDSPVGYLGSFTDDRAALLVKKLGGELVRTPAVPAPENARESQIRLEIADDGSAVLENETRLTGPAHEFYRYLSNDKDPLNAQKTWVKNSPLPTFSIQNWGIEAGDAPVAHFSAKLAVARWASKSGKRLFVQPFRHEASPAVPAEMVGRKWPINTCRASLQTDTIQVFYPKNRAVETALPIETKLDLAGFGQYSMKTEQMGEGEIRVVRRLERQAGELPKESYEEVRAFLKAVGKSDAGKLVFVDK